MPRFARNAPEDSVLHVYDRGINREDIFLNDGDRRTFLALANKYFREFGVSLLSYVLMGNHFHFLLSPSNVALSIPMHRILLRYSLYFNARYGRVGHLFQNRFKAKECRDLAYLLHLVSYIHLNPVRAGLVAQVQAWPWSSHDELLNGPEKYLDLRRLEAVAGLTVEQLRECYLERLAGWSEMRSQNLDQLVRMAAAFAGLTPDELSSDERGEAYTSGRLYVVRWATAAGYSLAQIAAALNCSKAAVSFLRSRG